VPGCLSSVSQAAINNRGLRRLVLHGKAEDDSHLEVCSALSMPFGRQRPKARRPEPRACMPFRRGPRRQGKRQLLCSPTQKRRPHSSLLFLFCVCGHDSLLLWRQCCTSLLGAASSKLAVVPSAIVQPPDEQAAPQPSANAAVPLACARCRSFAPQWPHGPSPGVLAAQPTALPRAAGAEQSRLWTGAGGSHGSWCRSRAAERFPGTGAERSFLLCLLQHPARPRALRGPHARPHPRQQRCRADARSSAAQFPGLQSDASPRSAAGPGAGTAGPAGCHQGGEVAADSKPRAKAAGGFPAAGSGLSQGPSSRPVSRAQPAALP